MVQSSCRFSVRIGNFPDTISTKKKSLTEKLKSNVHQGDKVLSGVVSKEDNKAVQIELKKILPLMYTKMLYLKKDMTIQRVEPMTF